MQAMPDDQVLTASPEEMISSDAAAVQSIALPASQRAEGVAFSPSGNVLAVATADTNAVLLFARQPGESFDRTPFCTISGPESRLNYPHDVSFARSGDKELLAVAQRRGSIAIYEKTATDESYGSEPVFEITGPKARLQGSDGVAFVPPDNDQLAVCNLERGSITFYRMSSETPVRFDLEPVLELWHPSLVQPDGLAFSSCGRWLATANHGGQSVSVFRRRRTNLVRGASRYWQSPVTVIKDSDLRYPHSVAFCSRTSRLVVTNAGGNYFSVYEPFGDGIDMRWSQRSSFKQVIGTAREFDAVNASNKMEGGPKGVAICESSVAVCTPQHGVSIFALKA